MQVDTKKADTAKKGKEPNAINVFQLCNKCMEFQLLNRHGITNIIGEQATINLLSSTQNIHLRSIN